MPEAPENSPTPKPDFAGELDIAGIVPETPRTVELAYLFDVDGVLTDPGQKRVVYEALYGEILKRLYKGEPVGFNTGRSNSWMLERVIDPLRERVSDLSTLSNFVAIGEKGGTWITFDGEGNIHQGKSKELVMPDSLKDKVKVVIDEKYSDSMFYDESKETMISTEMKDGHSVLDYGQQQIQLVKDLQGIVRELGLDLKVDPTTIATDIENPHVGKFLGAERFLQFLRDKDIKPALIATFGDSTSDIDMADELERRGRAVKLVYMGKEKDVADLKKDYEIEYVGEYSRGTLEYLERQAT